MAADLVECPDTPQTLEHDLESFFWVLLWIILMQVPCTWRIEKRSIFINDTMNPKVYGQSGGPTKMTFLTNEQKLSQEDFEIPNNERLRSLLEAVKKVVAARHRLPPSRPGDTVYDAFVRTEQKTSDEIQREYRKEYAKYEVGLTFLKDHARMLGTFEAALSAQSEVEWPTNDPAKYQGIMASASTEAACNCGTKRSRSIAEQNGISLPPSSGKRHA
jgi:hypothetical protein